MAHEELTGAPASFESQTKPCLDHFVEKNIPDHNSGARVGQPAAVSPATRAQVDARAHELAVIAGRAPPYVTQADYQQAKRELTGETDLDRQNAVLDGRPMPMPVHVSLPQAAAPRPEQVGYTP